MTEDRTDEILRKLGRFAEFIDLFLERADPKTKQLYGECHKEIYGY
jgi:hypothetical protein